MILKDHVKELCVNHLQLKIKGIKNIMELKVGDQVEIIKKCLCGAGNQTGMTGIIISKHYSSYRIEISNKEKTDKHYWYHARECLRLVNKGFDPDKIISEAFGVKDKRN